MSSNKPDENKPTGDEFAAINCSAASVDETPDGVPHPEDFCQKCKQPNIVWFAQSELWNKYAGDKHGILCPVCFAIQAQAAGFNPTAWELKPKSRRLTYYVDCVNACRANPRAVKEYTNDGCVFCPECGEHGVIYDLRGEER